MIRNNPNRTIRRGRGPYRQRQHTTWSSWSAIRIAQCIMMVMASGFFLNLFFLHNKLNLNLNDIGSKVSSSVSMKKLEEARRSMMKLAQAESGEDQADQEEWKNVGSEQWVPDRLVMERMHSFNLNGLQICGDETKFYNAHHENSLKKRKKITSKQLSTMANSIPVKENFDLNLQQYGFMATYMDLLHPKNYTAFEKKQLKREKMIKERELAKQGLVAPPKPPYNESTCALPNPTGTACNVKDFSIVVTSIGKNLRTLFVNIVTWLLHEMVAEVFIVLPQREYETLTSAASNANATNNTSLSNNFFFAKKLLDWHNDPNHKAKLTFDDSLFYSLAMFKPVSEAILFMDGDVLWDGTYLKQISDGFHKWRNHPHTLVATNTIPIQPAPQHHQEQSMERGKKKKRRSSEVSPICMGDEDTDRDVKRNGKNKDKFKAKVQLWDHSINNVMVSHVPELTGLFIHRNYLCFLGHPTIEGVRDELATNLILTSKKKGSSKNIFEVESQILDHIKIAMGVYFMQLSFNAPMNFDLIEVNDSSINEAHERENNNDSSNNKKKQKRFWWPQRYLKRRYMEKKNINNAAKKQEEHRPTLQRKRELERLLSSLYSYFGYIPIPSATTNAIFDNNPFMNVCED